MKAFIIGTVITVASGVGIYFVGGLTTLALSVLIRLFLLGPFLTMGASLVMGAIDGVEDIVTGIKETVKEFADPSIGTGVEAEVVN